MEIIFVVVRHITKKLDNSHNIWKACYESIRKYYNNKIIVIDNNSDYSLFNDDDSLTNCQIIKSEFPESRLFSPFLELLKVDFDRAIIIHDGTIFQKFVDFSKFDSVKFIWHFNTKEYDDHYLIGKQLQALQNNSDLFTNFNNKNFTGCMGCCIAITKPFLNTLQERHDIQNLKYIIQDQNDAIAFERTLSLLCLLNNSNLTNDLSFEGEIQHMCWGYRYSDFVNNRIIVNGIDTTNKDIIKIFGART